MRDTRQSFKRSQWILTANQKKRAYRLIRCLSERGLHPTITDEGVAIATSWLQREYYLGKASRRPK